MAQGCIWTGRLVDDVNFNFGTEGNPWCWFKLAVPRTYRPKEGKKVKVDWLEFKAFGNVAEDLGDGEKGQLFEIHGHVENYSREKKDGGGKEYGMQIVADFGINHSKKPDETAE